MEWKAGAISSLFQVFHICSDETMDVEGELTLMLFTLTFPCVTRDRLPNLDLLRMHLKLT